jgi:hypothetical protein
MVIASVVISKRLQTFNKEVANMAAKLYTLTAGNTTFQNISICAVYAAL